MRILQAGLFAAICAFQTGQAWAFQIYDCDNTADEVLLLSKDQRNAFGLHVIGLVERQQLLSEDGRVLCQGLALFSDGSRDEMRYVSYVEFDQWWIQYEAVSDAGYPDILLLDHERAERGEQDAKLPQAIAELLEELEAFPAENFNPGDAPLTIQLQISEFGFLEGIKRVSETGRAVSLSLMDDRERAVMGVFTSAFADPLWQRAAKVALTWTFTAIPSQVPGAPPIINWSGSGEIVPEAAPVTQVAEPPAPPSPAATPAEDPPAVSPPPATPPAGNPAQEVGTASADVAEVFASATKTKPGKTKSKPDLLTCAYSIDRLSDGGRQMIGRGQVEVRNGMLVPVNAEWFTEGQDAEDPFAGFSLSVGDDGAISGSIPVYFLFAQTDRPPNEPVMAGIELPSDNGAMPHNGEAQFPLDHVFTGAFTLAGCFTAAP